MVRTTVHPSQHLISCDSCDSQVPPFVVDPSYGPASTLLANVKLAIRYPNTSMLGMDTEAEFSDTNNFYHNPLPLSADRTSAME